MNKIKQERNRVNKELGLQMIRVKNYRKLFLKMKEKEKLAVFDILYINLNFDRNGKFYRVNLKVVHTHSHAKLIQ